MKIGARVIKTAIAAPIAMMIASYFNLEFYTAAGIITILSIQNTRKKTFLLAINRTVATIVSLAIASALFYVLQPTPVAFGLFLIIFIPIASRFKMNDSIVVCSVLVTHLLAKGLSVDILLNCFYLMFIGTAVGMIVNVYIPSDFKDIQLAQKEIDDNMRLVLYSFSNILKNGYDKDQAVPYLEALHTYLEKGIKKVKSYSENRFISPDILYYIQYIEMRSMQYEQLVKMQNHLKDFSHAKDQARLVYEFTFNVASSFNEFNDGTALMNDLEELLSYFRNQDLPKSRPEFENRAALYYYLNDFEYFLDYKQQFILSHPKKIKHEHIEKSPE